MNILIINSAEPGITEFTFPISDILKKNKVEADIIEYRESTSVSFTNYDGVIISGSPQGDDIVEHHQPWFQWIKEYSKPVLGICAGHHITGYLYGAEYLRSVEPESGVIAIELVKDDPIFKGLSKGFQVKQMHNDSITLPDNFIHLAKSDGCFNQAMRHSEKPLYTFQFHPEFVTHEIFVNFIKICENGSK